MHLTLFSITFTLIPSVTQTRHLENVSLIFHPGQKQWDLGTIEVCSLHCFDGVGSNPSPPLCEFVLLALKSFWNKTGSKSDESVAYALCHVALDQ